MLHRDRVAAAIAGLDPAARAVLELSARRGLSENEIGGLLGMDPAEIRQRRQESIAELGSVLGVSATHHYELQDLLTRLDESEWRGQSGTSAGPADRPRGRAALAAAGVLLVLAAAVAVLVLGSADDDSDPDRRAEPRAPKPKAQKPQAGEPPVAAGRVIEMERLNDTRGRGTAQIRRTGDRAHVRIRAAGFLRPRGGGYAVWLFNSRGDARRLYATETTSIQRDFPLPANVSRYRFIEVARAIPRLTSPHSGLTLLRAPVAELARRSR